MANQEYRRSLIMLRGLEKGYNGHARLERRVLSATLDFTVGGSRSGEVLAAAMLGPRGGKWTARTMGTLREDGRGQRGLFTSFDPRNLAGLDLNEETALVVSRLADDRVTPVLYGYINGSRPMDWAAIQRALEESYSIPPAQPEAQNQTEATPASGTQNQAETTPIPEPQNQPETTPVPEPQNPTQRTPVPEPQSVSREENAAKPEAVSDPASEGEPKTKPLPAGTRLDLDITKPWPADVESLRILFLTQPPYEPLAVDGYTFVRAAMAEETGIDHCAVGIRAENGEVTGVCYAIPMAYSPEPPAGLEGYHWIGDQNRGWWTTCDDLTEKTSD